MSEDGFDYGVKPDFGDPEVDRERLFSVFGAVTLLIVYVVSAALDVADLFLSINAPRAIAKLACTIQPLALVKIPFAVSSTNPDPCLGEFRELVVSLTFLSFKMTMAIVTFAILWIFLKSDGVQSMRDIYWRRFEAVGGYRKELNSFAKNSIGILVFFTACFLLASVVAGYPATLFLLGEKFIIEGGLAVAIPVLAVDFIVKASVFIFFAVPHQGPGPIPRP